MRRPEPVGSPNNKPPNPEGAEPTSRVGTPHPTRSRVGGRHYSLTAAAPTKSLSELFEEEDDCRTVVAGAAGDGSPPEKTGRPYLPADAVETVSPFDLIEEAVTNALKSEPCVFIKPASVTIRDLKHYATKARRRRMTQKKQDVMSKIWSCIREHGYRDMAAAAHSALLLAPPRFTPPEGITVDDVRGFLENRPQRLPGCSVEQDQQAMQLISQYLEEQNTRAIIDAWRTDPSTIPNTMTLDGMLQLLEEAEQNNLIDSPLAEQVRANITFVQDECKTWIINKLRAITRAAVRGYSRDVFVPPPNTPPELLHAFVTEMSAERDQTIRLPIIYQPQQGRRSNTQEHSGYLTEAQTQRAVALIQAYLDSRDSRLH